MSQRITVIVKNNDLHDGGSAEFDLLVVVVAEQVQLEEELLIRLPLVVVNNGYTNLKLNFILNMFNLIYFFRQCMVTTKDLKGKVYGI